MPNLQKMRSQERAGKMAVKSKDGVRDDIRKLEMQLLETSEIAGLFEHPGWPLLMGQFQHTKHKLEAELYAEGPMSVENIQDLRAQLIYVNRVLHLDTTVRNTIDSISNELKALSGRLADGQAEKKV